jgi:DNA polymerase I-like protein with 3'-5' exonuclease and polymerase domains
MLRYREQATLLHTFVEPYASLHRNGVLHPTYNQAVRTGRMSCSHPNAQQLSAEAKAYVHPPVGRWFVSHDASQIEFRILVHYMRNEEAIRAYGADPRTDYHEWVARLCGIPRRPAKNVNFAMGYGAGRPRVVSMLSQEPELVSGLLVAVDDAIASGRCDPSRRKEMFDQLCRRRGHEVYRTYHARLPELARLSKEATRNAERRGYVFNGYGRRRYLRRAKSYKALNAVVQSFAADMMKDRVAAIAPRYCREARDLGLTIHAIVHDEVLMSCEPDVARDDRALAWMRDVLEHPSRSLRVPVRWETKRGDATWATLTAT